MSRAIQEKYDEAVEKHEGNLSSRKENKDPENRFKDSMKNLINQHSDKEHEAKKSCSELIIFFLSKFLDDIVFCIFMGIQEFGDQSYL